MCGSPDGDAPASGSRLPTTNTASHKESFPWDAGVYDAHCHPTDTMSSISRVPGLKAQVLTIMATRGQDQNLVASVAQEHGIADRNAFSPSTSTLPDGEKHVRKVVPAFGWHPWFSYQLYDDVSTSPQRLTYNPKAQDKAAEKEKHYTAILTESVPTAELIAALPEPKALSTLLAETRSRLEQYPLALVGEVGLDKTFRLPAWDSDERAYYEDGLTPGGREGRRLSPHRVDLDHQAAILDAQLRLAGELGRAASVHGVQAHGALYRAISALWKGHEKEVLSKRQQKRIAEGAEDFSDDEDDEAQRGKPRPFPPRICLHSYSGSVPMLKQWLAPEIPACIFFSFSAAVNLSTPATQSKFPDMVRACPDDRILVESDLHRAGDDMEQLLEEMYRHVCEIKGWGLREGVERIRRNYEEFILG